MLVAQANAEKIQIFFQAQFRTSMKCTDNKTSETHNSQWHGAYITKDDQEGKWQTASVMVNHPNTPVIGKQNPVEFVFLLLQIGVIFLVCYMYL
jgi:hypothetical protein